MYAYNYSDITSSPLNMHYFLFRKCGEKQNRIQQQNNHNTGQIVDNLHAKRLRKTMQDNLTNTAQFTEVTVGF